MICIFRKIQVLFNLHWSPNALVCVCVCVCVCVYACVYVCKCVCVCALSSSIGLPEQEIPQRCMKNNLTTTAISPKPTPPPFCCCCCCCWAGWCDRGVRSPFLLPPFINMEQKILSHVKKYIHIGHLCWTQQAFVDAETQTTCNFSPAVIGLWSTSLPLSQARNNKSSIYR